MTSGESGCALPTGMPGWWPGRRGGKPPFVRLEGNALGLLGRPDDAVAVLVAALEVGRLRVLLAGAVIPHESAALGASRGSAARRVACRCRRSVAVARAGGVAVTVAAVTVRRRIVLAGAQHLAQRLQGRRGELPLAAVVVGPHLRDRVEVAAQPEGGAGALEGLRLGGGRGVLLDHGAAVVARVGLQALADGLASHAGHGECTGDDHAIARVLAGVLIAPVRRHRVEAALVDARVHVSQRQRAGFVLRGRAGLELHGFGIEGLRQVGKHGVEGLACRGGRGQAGNGVNPICRYSSSRSSCLRV